MTTEEIINAQEEWEAFQPAQVLSPDISNKLWNSIHKNTATRYSFIRWVAAAASVLLIIGLPWHFIAKREKTSAVTVATTNSTPQKMTLALSDGSTVELTPNSTLSYPQNFDAAQREVALHGDATFTIAKDVAKPFSVHSQSVLITVLGTRFMVRSKEAKVILLEGRILVKTPKKEFYLAPGDIFISDRIFRLEKDKGDCYVFDNYPLDVIFDQLQMIYHTKITYDKAALGNRTFIGKIDKKDALYHILKSIALLNNFGLHQQGDSFIISSQY